MTGKMTDTWHNVIHLEQFNYKDEQSMPAFHMLTYAMFFHQSNQICFSQVWRRRSLPTDHLQSGGLKHLPLLVMGYHSATPVLVWVHLQVVPLQDDKSTGMEL